MNQQQMGYGVYGGNQDGYGGYPQQQQQQRMNSGMQSKGGQSYGSPSGADSYQHHGGQGYGYQGDYGGGYSQGEYPYYGDESGGGHYGMGGAQWKGGGGFDPATSMDGKGRGGGCWKGEKGKGGKPGRGKDRADDGGNDWEALGRMRAD